MLPNDFHDAMMARGATHTPSPLDDGSGDLYIIQKGGVCVVVAALPKLLDGEEVPSQLVERVKQNVIAAGLPPIP